MTTTITTQEGGRQIVVQGPRSGARMTVEDVRALELRGSELRDQLRQAQAQRREVATEMRAADDAARAGLEQRLKVIDERIIQLENDITANGQQLTSLPAGIAMAARRQEQMERAAASDDEGEMMALGLFFGAAGMLTLGWLRRIVRRRRQTEQPAIAGVQSEQLLRLEHAVDAIAVEVERIAEGQRFTAKLMAESHERGRRDAVGRDVANNY